MVPDLRAYDRNEVRLTLVTVLEAKNMQEIMHTEVMNTMSSNRFIENVILENVIYWCLS